MTSTSVDIVVPYVTLQSVVKQILERHGHPLQYVDLSGDDEAYWRLLKGIWGKQETVVIHEHDILVWPGGVEELLACPALWCSYSYDQRGIGLYHSFGCVKFSGEMMKQTQGIWDELTDKHWSMLDSQFEWLTFKRGIRPHGHRPPVIHLHDYNVS